MSAILKKIEVKREKRGGFLVPTVDEVSAYMREKKNWPEKFAQFYAEKFWNNYEASGWKLSNGNSMKSWQAAFCAQWQAVRFKEDIEFLQACLKEIPMQNVNKKESRLNELLNRFKTNFETVTDESLIRAYDYMKEHKLIRLSSEEVRYIKAAYGTNVERGKAACVKTMFTNMINHGKCF
jgi:hypothetical protein